MLSARERDDLRLIPLFASLDEETLTQLGGMSVVRHYDRGEVIEVEGARGGSLRFVKSGLVKLSTTSADGREQVLRLVPAGESFNLMAALDGQPSAATATALDRTTIYSIRRDALSRLLAERPEVARAAMVALAATTRELISLAKDLALYHVDERLARLLLDQERCACERCRKHYMTQQEMAAIIGTAREMVGRALHNFQAAGIIELHHGHVVVIDHERLRAVAREQPGSPRARRRGRHAALPVASEASQASDADTTALDVAR